MHVSWFSVCMSHNYSLWFPLLSCRCAPEPAEYTTPMPSTTTSTTTAPPPTTTTKPTSQPSFPTTTPTTTAASTTTPRPCLGDTSMYRLQCDMVCFTCIYFKNYSKRAANLHCLWSSYDPMVSTSLLDLTLAGFKPQMYNLLGKLTLWPYESTV